MKFMAGTLSVSCCTALARAMMPVPIPTMMLRSYSAICPNASSSLYCLADLSTAILENGGDFIHAMGYPAGFYNDERMPLMFAIRAEGIDL
jgi:hypothetical protein